MTGNNTPVFFIRDPIKFPDFIHTQKKDPRTNLKNPTPGWDFWSLTPESTHQLTTLFSDRGTPDGYRHINGYSSHTFRWINKSGEAFWVKLHFKTLSGIKTLSAKQANDLMTDPDYAQRDLVNHLDAGKTAEWQLSIQAIPERDGFNYRWNLFDVTKVVPHGDYPLIPIGKLVLNRNVDNYFAETEQSAFSPGHLVPGMEPSLDKMLQGRLFSYPDTHRHRLGANYDMIPINCPYRAKVANTQRDGPMRVDKNGGNNTLFQVTVQTTSPTPWDPTRPISSASTKKPDTNPTELPDLLPDINPTIPTVISLNLDPSTERLCAMLVNKTPSSTSSEA